MTVDLLDAIDGATAGLLTTTLRPWLLGAGVRLQYDGARGVLSAVSAAADEDHLRAIAPQLAAAVGAIVAVKGAW